MLQWMGGSRRKVTSSRNSIHNRQKQYFEQRKRKQQVPGLESLSDTHKQAYYNKEPRSLDILSLTNLATIAQQGYSSGNNASSITVLDVPQKGSHVSHLSPENVSKKVTSRFPGDLKKPCSKQGHLTPTRIAADNGLQNVPSFHGNSSKIDKRKVQSSYCEYTSNNTKKTSKPEEEEAQNDVSVFDLLGDDGPNSISYGGRVPEAHVALSVEGLGKVGIGTPVHSPKRYDRNPPSPPRAPRRIRSSSKHECSQYRFGIKMNALMQDIREEQDGSPLEPLCDRGGIFDDEFSYEKNTLFMFSCASPDAYENQNRKFDYEGESFYTGGQENQSWNALSPQYFTDLTSEKECNPVLFDRDRRHSRDEMSSPDGLFHSPDWSFLGMEDSQDNMSFLSEESSSAAVMDERSYDLGSHSMRFKKSKIKHYSQNQKNSRKKYDVGEFPADQIDHAGLEEFLHEWNIPKSENRKNMTIPWNSKTGHFSNNHSTFQDTRSLSHKLLSEDDLFDLFPSPQLYPSTKSTCRDSKLNDPKINEPSTNFIYEDEILKQFSVPDVPSPAAFPWETEDNFLHSPFARDFDAQFPGLSKKKNICENSEDGSRRSPEKPQNQDSIEKNSLSSNGRTAGVADSKKNCSENAELKCESPVLFDGPSVETNEEVPRAMEEDPLQFENCVDDNLNHFDSHDPVPTQVATKEENSEPANKNVEGDASYRVMLERYVLQLICVQKVLLEASQKDIKKNVG